MSKTVTLVIALALLPLSSLASALNADNLNPFYMQNQNPLILLHQLPAADTLIPPSQGLVLHTALNISNSLNNQFNRDEHLFFDYELQHLTLFAKRRINQHWTVGLNLPFLRYQTGFLDGFIENFHDTFGFRRGDRPRFAQAQFNLHYTHSGRTWLNHHLPTSGIGDISLDIARLFAQAPEHCSSMQFSIKLPSGNATKLTGSGAPDAAFWFAHERNLSLHWYFYAHAGVLRMGRGDILPEHQRSHASFASTTLAWQAYKNIDFKLQLDAHTALYKNSRLPLLGDAMQLTLGGSWRLSSKNILDIGVSEDIKVDSAPDVNFHFAWRHLH